jgi:hypothetical protein
MCDTPWLHSALTCVQALYLGIRLWGLSDTQKSERRR